MLSKEQKEFYDQQGYILVEDVLTSEQLADARRVTSDLMDKSRTLTSSNQWFDLDEGHTCEQPKLTRIKLPHKQHPLFWDLIKNSRITQVLNDLLGADTTLLTAKLNTKAPGGGAAVEWHQDWAFYPHTNDDLLAFGVMLDDVTLENGPLQVIPGSHRGPLLSHHQHGTFCGAVDPKDPDFPVEKAVTLTGRAGSMTVHHVRTLHGSAPNLSDHTRRVLFYEVASADAWPILGARSYIHALGQDKFWMDLQERMITGQPCLTPRLKTVPVRMPLPPAPDSSSIFQTQKSGGARSVFTKPEG